MRNRILRRTGVSIICFAALAAVSLLAGTPRADTGGTAITISSAMPSELNPPYNPGGHPAGGAPDATPAQAALFAWQEFIAMNWPAGPQQGMPGQRDSPSTTVRFGDAGYAGPLVWETLRGKVETFPGNTNPFSVVFPPGYPGPSGDKSYGYDALPIYNYAQPVMACDPKQQGDATPWVNLDETDQITLDNMYAGVVAPGASPGNSSPQLVRFLAKSNRSEYVYAIESSTVTDPTKLWWAAIPKDVVDATKAYLAQHQASPPSGSHDMVSQKDGTIEIKAAWRPLNPAEAASGRFHTQTVRFYEGPPLTGPWCYVDAVWGLIALHIIQKTPSAPYFVYATFEQADNILAKDGKRVEDAEGRIVIRRPTATTPQVCLVDPQPPSTPPPAMEMTSALGRVVITRDPVTCRPELTPPIAYCDSPGSRLYYRNASVPGPNNAPSGGDICVETRDNPIPDYAIQANIAAHAAIRAYAQANGLGTPPWLSYKLVNVQYYPYDKIPDPKKPNGSPYTSKPPYSAQNPAAASFYQANIVVETNRSLQIFSGGLSPNIATDWNADGTPHKNSYYGGHFYNMGGCMGCHGSQGQNPLVPYSAGDFSVILARGAVAHPESPSVATSQGMTPAARNRSISP